MTRGNAHNFENLRHSKGMERKIVWSIITQYICFFFVCSCTGFLWEVLIFLVKDGEFCKRGFLYGPWLPIYGIGGVLFHLILRKRKDHPVQIFLLSMLLGTGVELLAGWFLDKVWHLRYWDYSRNLLNLHGYICLYSVIGFGIAGVLWVCLFSKLTLKMWIHIPPRIRNVIVTLLVAAFLFDCAASLIYPNIGDGITF